MKDDYKITRKNKLIGNKKVLNIVLVATLSALSITISYILAPLVNVELMSFTIFISGYLFGILVGIGVGTISSVIYYGWNPYGPSNPPTYITCVICMILFGIIGGLLKLKSNNTHNNNSSNKKLKYSAWNIYKFGFIGLILTLVFDISTNVITGFVFYGGNITISIVLGIPFMLIHVISNTAVFSALTIPIINSINSINHINYS
ncbi:MAG: hypothetical protein ACTSPY_09945 [Candidatus Helarchaeota archaeon]